MSASQNPNRRAESESSANKAAAQHTKDARLHAVFDQTGDEQEAYLLKMQRGGYIQPFGFLLAVDDPSFRLIAYSENAGEMLASTPPSVPILENPEFSTVPSLENPEFMTIGTDVRTLFTSSCSALLERAFRSGEITMLNPLLVHSKSSGKPFYAILHRIDVGVVMDLEPADLALSIVGVAQSQKLALNAISYLQSLPGGDIKLLCNGVVQKVRELTGYDRVMVYKFHDDDHGEVLAESKRHDIEPYIGLHYPSTDVPQASRFLFKQNKVRMIVDCNAIPVKVVQDEALMQQPLCLVGSTLRAPHGCHSKYMSNMGSIASLVLAVIVNEDGVSDGRLWGLVVGHHTIDRFVHFPLRLACVFLMQAFGLQLKMELKLAAQLSEKRILKMQTMFCDMLYKGLPTGNIIMQQNPSIMDLVKCDGAALYHQGRYSPLGLTPTKSQIDEIVQWLLALQGDSIGLSTDSLANAGFQGAASLGDAVCGMAVANINSRDFIFWFRSDTAKVINWGGAKHHPQDRDDGLKMNPRGSFNAFMEVVKGRSLPWENEEMDVIHSLQLIFRDCEGQSSKLLNRLEELSCATKEMSRLIETAPTPIFAVDAEGLINGWNSKAAELIGISVEEAMGKSLVSDLVHTDSEEIAADLLSHALKGVEKHDVELRLRTFGAQTSKTAVFLVVNACSSKDHTKNVVGVCFIGQDVTDHKVEVDKFVKIQGDYKAIVHSPSPMIPPIFAADENLCCSEWNTAMENLTGYSRVEIVGKMLVGEIFGSFCQLRGSDETTELKIVLHTAIAGDDTEKFEYL